MSTVLVVTDHDDHQADLAVAELLRRNENVVRLDPGAGPVDMDVELVAGRWQGIIRDEHRAVRLEDVVGVLWRWPTPPAGHPAIADPDRRAWAAREDAAGLLGVLRSLPVRWINHPSAVTAANFKPVQLTVAAGVGLAVPPTVITTGGEAAHRWMTNRAALYKAFHAQGTGDCEMVMATPVTGEDLPPKLGAASMFQEIVGGHQVRATFVGEESFAVVISGAATIDWRADPSVTHTVLHVPPRVHAQVRAYMRHFGLEYGAVDFVVDPGKGWVFLECNPLGMYGWVEIATGLPITAAIATHLCAPVRSPVTAGHLMER
ncbi:MvdC/MvdD family ATP grasp protein [Actinomadura sp. LOL_016]|uniref:MvdC/MvdD family ATP grasp protein n=1 Tax=unclassified Actinomadura TaxID=2626254 RepID=UPI003A8049CE